MVLVKLVNQVLLVILMMMLILVNIVILVNMVNLVILLILVIVSESCGCGESGEFGSLVILLASSTILFPSLSLSYVIRIKPSVT